MEREKALAKNTLILGLGQLLPKLTTFITLPLLTTYITQEDYGAFELVNSLAMLLLPLITLQIHQATFRFIIQSKSKIEKSEYITTSLRFILICVAIITPILYIMVGITKLAIIDKLNICIFMFSQVFYLLIGQIIRGLEENFKYSIASILYSVINMVILVIFIVIMDMKLSGVLISSSIAYIISTIYMVLSSKMIFYINISLFSKNKLNEMLKFAIPVIPSSISLWVVSLSDRLIITNYMGASANAYYSVANKIPNLYSMAYNIFNLAWVESASKASEDDDKELYYSNLFNYLIKFLTGIMLILIAVSPFIFNIFINKQYDEAFIQVPILFFGAFFNSIVSFYGGIYIAIKKTNQVGISSALGAILNILINLR